MNRVLKSWCQQWKIKKFKLILAFSVSAETGAIFLIPEQPLIVKLLVLGPLIPAS